MDLDPDLLFALWLVPLLLVGLIGALVERGRRHRERLAAVAAALEDGVVDDGLTGWDVAGRRRGRRARLSLEGTLLVHRLEVAPGTAALELDDVQAARAWVAGDGSQAAEALVAVQQLAARGVRRLVVEDGWLTAPRESSEFAMRPASFEAVFDALERLLPLLQRAPLTIRVAGAERAAVAWTVDARTVCPYCRDGLGEDVAACDACHTAHHRECLAEAGGCTVFGCRGGPRREAHSEVRA